MRSDRWLEIFGSYLNEIKQIIERKDYVNNFELCIFDFTK